MCVSGSEGVVNNDAYSTMWNQKRAFALLLGALPLHNLLPILTGVRSLLEGKNHYQ